MPTNIEILATPEELQAALRDWTVDFKLFVAAIWVFPERVRVIKPGDLEWSIEAQPRFVLLDQAPILDAGHDLMAKFTKDQRGVCIHIGKSDAEALRASQVTFFGRGKPSGWRGEVLRRIKNWTGAGVWGVNPITNASAEYKQVRYTAGASKLQKQGGKLKSWIGNTEFTFQDPERQN